MVVWIEMMASAPGTCGHCVTTCVVVWIEINFRVSELLIILSPPAWWCGLKSGNGGHLAEGPDVTTCVVVWIEIRRRSWQRYR